MTCSAAAPRVFVSYAHDSADHKELVRRFATLLRRRIGLDVHLDQWYDHRRRDWALWATDHLTYSDFVLVVASPLYRRTSTGRTAHDEGRGSQFEAMIIRNMLTTNLRAETRRVLPVVLPGGSIDDIPPFLAPYSGTHFVIDSIDDDGVRSLLAAITGRAEHPMPARGHWQAAGPREKALVAQDLQWLVTSQDVKTGVARIGDIPYEHSVFVRGGTPAKAFIEADLGGAHARFTSVAGVLDDAREPFQVGMFAVYADGHKLEEVRVAHGRPAVVAVDVTGASQLRLEMWRPAVSPSPFLSGASGYGRPPELAWGDPAVT